MLLMQTTSGPGSQHNSLRALSRDIPWPKLWDLVRDHGIQGTRSLVMFLRVLATSILENWKCPLCESKLQRDSVFADHIALRHLAKPLNDILPFLIDGDDDLFFVGTELKRLYASYCSTTLVIACICSQIIFVSLTGKQLTLYVLNLFLYP